MRKKHSSLLRKLISTNSLNQSFQDNRDVCNSSILVAVNKRRTALTVIEADLNHEVTSVADNSKNFTEKVLNPKECEIASILIKSKVPLSRINEYIALNDVDGLDYLSVLKTLMLEHPCGYFEFKKFTKSPEAVYIQTSSIKDKIDGIYNRNIQIVCSNAKDAKTYVFTILDVDLDGNINVLATCFVLVNAEIGFRYLIETFVKVNPEFCNQLHGIVLDTNRKSVDFVKQLIPQTKVAWSKSYIMDKFKEEVRKFGTDFQMQLNLRQSIMQSSSEEIYDSLLKDLVKFSSISDFKEFLNSWDSYKELWVKYVLDLSFQDLALEQKFTASIKYIIESSSSLSEVIKAFSNYDGVKILEKDNTNISHVETSMELYRSFCDPKFSDNIFCQLVIALNSVYKFDDKVDFIIVKRKDNDSEYYLNRSITTCTCQFFTETEFPCQHLFGYIKHIGGPLFNNTLIPEKYRKVKFLSLEALANSQGLQSYRTYFQQELQNKLDNLLDEIKDRFCSQSNQKEFILKVLHQLLSVMRGQHNTVDIDMLSYHDGNILSENSSKFSRKRGRTTKNNQIKKKQCTTNFTTSQRTHSKHNLRTNLKHKFIKRECYTNDSRKISDEEDGSFSTNNRNSSSLSSNEQVSDFDPTSTLVDNTSEGFYLNTESENTESQTSLLKDISSLSQSNIIVGDENMQMSSQPNKAKTKNNQGDDERNDDEDAEEDETDYDYKEIVFKRENIQKEFEQFLLETPDEVVNEVIQVASQNYSSKDESELYESTRSESATQFLLNICTDSETIKFIVECLKFSYPVGFNPKSYHIAACTLYHAYVMAAPVLDIVQSLRVWPSFLPHIPPTRTLEEERNLSQDQTLTVIGNKLNSEDMKTLYPDQELTSNMVHAYLEVLGQKHSGKMFVIPFEVVNHWKQGSYSEMIFKKVHFKTFEYLVLPIHCGAELSGLERQSIEMTKPYWMALVANVQNRTVCVLSPRSEDKYIIAANGYMLQWRRYMQFRSVHTGEMLSVWNSQVINCNLQIKEHTSAVLMLMNVESTICGMHPATMTEAHIGHYLRHMAVTLRDTDRETTVLCIGGPECQQLAAQDADWLKCENCRTWWHRNCAVCDPIHVKDFYCTSCQHRITQARGLEILQNNKVIEDLITDEDLQDSGEIEFEIDEMIDREEDMDSTIVE